jgi:ComF family protein
MTTSQTHLNPFAPAPEGNRRGGLARRLVRASLDLVYPRHCPSCADPLLTSHDGSICRACASKIALIGPERCRKCGMPTGPHTEPQSSCAYCRNRNLRFRRATAPYRYDGVVRELIHALKYRGATSLAPHFAEMMGRDLADTGIMDEVDLVMPVPLHWLKQARRGYNQAELLAERLAGRSGLPVGRRGLRRVRHTPSQTALSGAERHENLQGAFAVRSPEAVKGRTILLCDDVMTTGATASDCARALLEAGARDVYVSVAAR